ncbi:MAG TPA: septal ring lytic transglycosylase RlpA family protein [Terriglobales bacterium]|nr:septal ring lytic transglycosylase RlpA family protein [Terriglobales bacterium]
MVAICLVTTMGAAPGTGSAKPKNKKPPIATPQSDPKPYQTGRASWYGKQFDGRTTASGEPYDMFQLTAAHRQLPLGTWVKVTNLRNGKWVIVRINDRGPVPESRIIDLSYGAAQLLDLRARGVERVRLDIVTPEVVAMATDLTGQQ